MVLILSDLYQEYFNTTYGNLTQYTAVITALSSYLRDKEGLSIWQGKGTIGPENVELEQASMMSVAKAFFHAAR